MLGGSIEMGLLGHFRDLDSPAELLHEQGVMFTFQLTGAAKNVLVMC